MGPEIAFIEASVTHARLRPRRNRFRYRVPYLAVPNAVLESKSARGLLSIDGANLFTVRTRDYGRAGVHGSSWVRHVLARTGIGEADSEIVLVTMPRVLGFAFNPVSFWLCLDRHGGLRAVIAEVNNTFGERHFYVCRHGDHRPITAEDRITAEKVFHVSPFLKVEGRYVFTFRYDEAAFGVRIDLHDGDGLILTTAMAGRREPLSSARLALTLLANPLLTLKVLGLIHYQALKLWAKGVAVVRKPAPAGEDATG